MSEIDDIKKRASDDDGLDQQYELGFRAGVSHTCSSLRHPRSPFLDDDQPVCACTFYDAAEPVDRPYTTAEEYLRRKLENPEYAAAYMAERERLDLEAHKELDGIKQRAAERRKWLGLGSGEYEGYVPVHQREREAEADLDRAIAIAEQNELTLERHIFNVSKGVAEYQEMEHERDQARAAARALRAMLLALKPINMDNEGCLCVMHNDCDICRALDVLWKWDEADTAWVEEV